MRFNVNRDEQKARISLFRKHVKQIKSLQFGNYVLADMLCQQTVLYSSKHFPERSYYFNKPIGFKSPDIRRISAKEAWDMGYKRLLEISRCMLEEAQLSHLELTFGQKKVALSVTFLVVATYMLWSFNIWAHLKWLSVHPYRIPIYILFQVIILIVSGLIVTTNRQDRFIEWLGIVMSGVSLIFTIVA